MLPIPSECREPAPNARRHGRVRTELTTCSLGSVVDVSASGLKIISRSKPPVELGRKINLTVAGPSGPFSLEVAVVRVTATKKGFEIGVQVANLTTQSRQALVELARGVSRSPGVELRDPHKRSQDAA